MSTILYTAAPSVPLGVTAAAGNAQATITFMAPASNGGATVGSYTVTASPGGATATGAGSPITVGGLANGTTYTFTVTATNAAATSPASEPSNPVTPSDGGAGGGTGGSGGAGGSGGTGDSAGTPTTGSSPTTPALTPVAGTAPGGQSLTPPKPTIVTVAVAILHPVTLGGIHPALIVIAHPSRATTLVLALHDTNGRTLATWHRSVKSGAHRLTFLLPPRALRAGKHTLRLSWATGRSKTVAVTIRPAPPRHR